MAVPGRGTWKHIGHSKYSRISSVEMLRVNVEAALADEVPVVKVVACCCCRDTARRVTGIFSTLKLDVTAFSLSVFD